MHIDHTTLRTTQLEATRDFFTSVFDLTEGLRPALIAATIAGHWLYHKDQPIVHLILSTPHPGTTQGYTVEAIDHTAFFMDDREAFVNKLHTLGIPFTPMELPDIGERRIFLHTPTGILLEAVFRTGH